MKDILSYFYEMKIDKFIDNDVIESNNRRYILKKIKESDYNILFQSQNSFFFFKIVVNTFKSFITEYKNEKYILFRIDFKNRCLEFSDILYLANIRCTVKDEIIDYSKVWTIKVDSFENYMKDNCMIKYINWNYYIGLSENAINYIKRLNYKEIRYGYIIKRFDDVRDLYDICNPLNIAYGPTVYTIAEYIKYCFFFLNYEIDLYPILNCNLSYMDYQFFIGRLIFPTYFFDCFNKAFDKEKYLKVINRSTEYLKFLKKIIIEIKKRHSKMPSIEWIFNQS